MRAGRTAFQRGRTAKPEPPDPLRDGADTDAHPISNPFVRFAGLGALDQGGPRPSVVFALDVTATTRLSRAFSSERSQLPPLADAHVGVLLLPIVERGFADPELPADIGRMRAALDLAQG